MVYRDRSLEKKFKLSLSHFPILILTGARQVGKTTFLTHLLQHSHEIIPFEPNLDVENARSEPELFFSNHPGPLVLDEIQYAPELIPTLKRIVDKDRTPGRYILTGSQQWQVMKNVSESLAGRAQILEMDGFSLPEISETKEPVLWLEMLLTGRDDFASGIHKQQLPLSLTEYFFRGQLPGVQDIPLSLISDYHRSYLNTYIERDARQLADLSDFQQFGQFYRLCGALSGQEINFSQLGRDIGMTPQSAKRWLSILKATYQWREIQAYSGNTVRRISGKPKGYFSDTGMLCHGLFLSGPEALPSHPQWGNIVETAVVNEIVRRTTLMDSPPMLHHWRSHNGAEVDLLLERDGCFWPVEVKATTRPAKKDLRGIKAFRETYPHLNIGKGIVIHLGESCLRLSDKDWAIPFK